MKTPILLGLALFALAPVQAQIFRPSSVNGALLGGIAGAMVGNNSGSLHHNAWQGAAIGSAAGLLLGAAADNSRRDYGNDAQVYASGGYVYRAGPRRPAGYGPYGYGYGYGSAANNGFWLGALAGGVIGHNSRGFHHDGWRGAAWGAGVGWLLGSVADASYGYRGYGYDYGYSRPVVLREAPVAQVQPQPAPAAQPQQVTIINNYYGNASPMSSANAMFGR